MQLRILTILLSLYKFFRFSPSIIIGVCKNRTHVVGLLIDVLVYLGSDPIHPADIVLTTLHVLNAPDYHIILGW